MFLGIVMPTETAAVGAVLSLGLAAWLQEALHQTVQITAMAMLIIICASLLSHDMALFATSDLHHLAGHGLASNCSTGLPARLFSRNHAFCEHRSRRPRDLVGRPDGASLRRGRGPYINAVKFDNSWLSKPL
jgi:hypothetical protein